MDNYLDQRTEYLPFVKGVGANLINLPKSLFGRIGTQQLSYTNIRKGADVTILRELGVTHIGHIAIRKSLGLNKATGQRSIFAEVTDFTTNQLINTAILQNEQAYGEFVRRVVLHLH